MCDIVNDDTTFISRFHIRENAPWVIVKYDVYCRERRHDTGGDIFKYLMSGNGDDFTQSKMYHPHNSLIRNLG